MVTHMTGITAYLENGATIEEAQAVAAHQSPRTTKLIFSASPREDIAAHECPRTTKLHDRTSDGLTLGDIERIAISPFQPKAASTLSHASKTVGEPFARAPARSVNRMVVRGESGHDGVASMAPANHGAGRC